MTMKGGVSVYGLRGQTFSGCTWWPFKSVHLYTGWSNASDYMDSDESFGCVAVHSPALQKAIDNRWNEMKQTSVKLSDDEKHICESMGVPLPPLPFKRKEENIQFAKCALDDDFPFKDD